MATLAGRRLTGPNLYADGPGAIVQVDADPGDDVAALLAAARQRLREGLGELGWEGAIEVRVWASGHGGELMVEAPFFRLYATVALAQWAFGELDPDATTLGAIRAQAEEEAALRRGAFAMAARADAEGVHWRVDDDELSIGRGPCALTWPLAQVPEPDAIDWAARRTKVPVALVTGTNGKTTCARLLSRMAKQAGARVGNTSTDGIAVDEVIVDAGDWTGPGGARAVLRRPDVDFAVLEVARGGILRRGLGVRSADAALVTNVSRDHLGEWGVDNLAELAAAKGVVTRVVAPTGRIVLGADSPPVVAWARDRALPAPVVWFSVDHANPVLVVHRASGGEVCTVVDGNVTWGIGEGAQALFAVADAPLCFGGRATHNVANVLACVAMARALGIPDAAIVSAATSFGAAADDNPGRARVWSIPKAGGEVTLFLDFAHNVAGITAIADLVRAGDRDVVLSFGMAGDRSDADLRDLGIALSAFAPRIAVLRDQAAYLRGRELGEVPRLVAEGLHTRLPDLPIHRTADEASALTTALAQAHPGELIVFLAHLERAPVAAWLHEHGASAAPSPLVPATTVG